MKKTLMLLSVAVLLAGCGEGGKEPSTTSEAPANSAAANATPSTGGKITTCNIETAAKMPLKAAVPVKAGDKVRFTGWAIDTQDHTVPKMATLHLASADGAVTRDAVIVMWRARPDVAGANGDDPAYTDSGFSVDVPTAGMAAGDYAVTIRYSDAKACSVVRHVSVQ